MGKGTATRRRVVEVRASGADRVELRAIEQLLSRSGAAVAVTRKGVVTRLPQTAIDGLKQVVHGLSHSGAVAVSVVDDEITTQAAADILNVSRPHLVKMLEEKRLPYRKVGTHRRLMRRDVLAYAQVEEKRRGAVLTKMVRDAERSGLDRKLDVTLDDVLTLEDEGAGR